jgi:hypothetical protein
MFQPVRPRLEHLNPLVSLRCSNRSNLLTSFEDLIKEGSSRAMARSTPVFLLPKQKVGTGWNVGTPHLALSPTRQTDFGATTYPLQLMPVQVDLQAEGLSKLLAFTDPKTFIRAKAAGLRYAVKSIPPAVAKNLRQYYSIPAGRIKDDVRRPIVTDDFIDIRFSRRPPTWRAYGAKQARGGVSYQIFKGQRRISSNVFFLPIGASPGLPVRRMGPGRSNLRTMYGPSIGSIFAGRSRYGQQIRQEVVKRTMDQHVIGVQRELARLSRGF